MRFCKKFLLFFIITKGCFSFLQAFEPGVEYYLGYIENDNLEKISWKNIQSIKEDLKEKPENHIVYLRIRLPEKNIEDYSLVYYSTEQFYEIYIENLKKENKIFEFHYGRFIPEKLSFTTGEVFKTIRLKNDYAGRYLYFKIFYASRFSFLNHGKIMILPTDDVYPHLIKNSLPGIILISFALISGILFILVSFSKYVEKKTFLGGGIFITFLGIKQFSESILPSFLIQVPVLWGYLAFYSSYIMMFGLFIFLDVVLKRKYRLILNTLFIIQILLLFLTVIIEAGGIAPLSQILNFYFIYLGIVIIIIFFLGIRSAFDNYTEAQMLLIGGSLLALSAIYEILARGFGLFDWNKNTLNLGIFIFIVSIISILVYRFVNIIKEKESYMNELISRNQEFLKLKEQLEKNLSEKDSELTKVMKKVKINKTLMEKELELAKKIQMNLIPKLPPIYDIKAFYKPMEQVCGDFYDFINLSDDKIGIFISDVSGHGVPAALITSMVKSAINQMKGEIGNPARFLSKLNDFLFFQTEGQFVTAFYGIYYRKSRRLIFANAGHSLPYKISENGIEKFSSENRGTPLGIMNSEELSKAGKKYINKNLKLKKGEKILLFTDGLTDTIPVKDVQNEAVYFGDEAFEKVLNEAKTLSSSEMLEKIYNELVRFRGINSFEDDICMICLEAS